MTRSANTRRPISGLARRELAHLLSAVPTVSELIPGFVTGRWQGVMAPVGTPKPLIDKLNAEMAKIVKIPEVREKMAAQGADPQTGTPEEFAGWMKSEVANWAKVINDANIKLE